MITALTINRPNWLHNEGIGDSKLLRSSDGKMCCLGFYSLACGVSKSDITDCETACEIDGLPNEMRWLIDKENWDNSTVACDMMLANDNTSKQRTSTEIEAFLTRKFAEHDITVTFTDEPLEA